MNLKNIDIEKLENLPQKQKMTERLTNRLELYNLGWDCRGEYRRSENYSKATSLFYGSIGKPMSELREKLKSILTPRRYDYLGFIKNKICVLCKDCSGNYVDNRGQVEIREIFYVDNDDILRHIPYISSNSRKRSISWQEHYSYITKRKKRFVKNTIKFDISLKLINKPLVYKYYTDLLKNRSFYFRYVNDLILCLKRVTEDPTLYGYRWGNYYYRKSYYQKEIKNYSKKLEDIEYKIQKFIDGDVSDFYRSDEYKQMYSSLKECHHVDPGPFKQTPII